MPLLDHFHPPLSQLRHWEAFHAAWAAEIMRTLNRKVLPARCFAEAQVNLSGRAEADAAAFDLDTEVRVFEMTSAPTLVGAVQLVSLSNKDRPDSRRAFVTRCAGYLNQGVGLVIVDVVTKRMANLHDELGRLLEEPRFAFFTETPLYATAYRPARREGRPMIDVWREPLKLGAQLPTMPLALRGLTTVPLDLETTYDTACQDSRISP